MREYARTTEFGAPERARGVFLLPFCVSRSNAICCRPSGPSRVREGPTGVVALLLVTPRLETETAQIKYRATAPRPALLLDVGGRGELRAAQRLPDDLQRQVRRVAPPREQPDEPTRLGLRLELS